MGMSHPGPQSQSTWPRGCSRRLSWPASCLAGDLAAHHVQVSATTGMSSPLLSVLLGLLPLLLIGGLLYMFVRTTRRHVGSLDGLGGQAPWRRRRRGSSMTNARPPGSLTWPATPR